FNFTVYGYDLQNAQTTPAVNYSIFISNTGSGLQITTTSIPNGTVNVGYSVQLQATGGNGTYVWSPVSGSVPGLFLSPNGVQTGSTATISGTPVSPGNYTFTIQVTSGGLTAQQTYNITISGTGGGLQITTTSIPNGT